MHAMPELGCLWPLLSASPFIMRLLCTQEGPCLCGVHAETELSCSNRKPRLHLGAVSAARRNLLEDPWAEPSPDMFTRSVSPEQAPDQATYLNIDFEGGDPVALDGEKLSPATLLARLNKVRCPFRLPALIHAFGPPWVPTPSLSSCLSAAAFY